MKHLPLLLVLVAACAMQANAQCFEPDASIWLNTWSSCETKRNPVSTYGQSHWIQFDLGSVRHLSRTWVWNANDPAKLDEGFDEVNVDYSIDGKTWEHWGKMRFPQASGEAVYGGFPGPDLRKIKAQYVVFTATSNHGHPSCSGLAEVKFNLLPHAVTNVPSPFGEDFEDEAELYLFPNPASEFVTVEAFGWSEEEEVLVAIVGMDGRIWYEDLMELEQEEEGFQLPVQQLPTGVYILSMANDEQRSAARFVVHH